ncbi:MAG: aldehyde dehydrogenase family protein [Alphaproteobacteria bacterium]|nr:aldehyde dehydrogenase family protein [Alphaproteobacteria bacterium]
MSQAIAKPRHGDPEPSQAAAAVDDLVRRGRAAMDAIADVDQARIDEAVTALAWSIYKPEHAADLAQLAVRDTGLGNAPDKVIKNTRKTFGTLRDLMRVRTVGVIEEDKAKGIVKYAKPVGVVGAITPSTNPAATPVNKAMMAVKGGNAVIIAPSPSGYATTGKTVDYMRAELKKIGLPEDLVQILPAPVNKEMTMALMKAVDLVVVTGSQNNVRGAYSSGTPAIGVGAGNVPVIIDGSADLDDAAEKICASKIFDNATSCSSENSVTIVESVYEAAIEALERAGGYRATPEECVRIREALWQDGKLNRHIIARDAAVFAEQCGLPEAAKSAKFFMVEDEGVGPDRPFSGEKLSLALTIYKAKDFGAAKDHVQAILDYQGAGHSVGIHTNDMAQPRELAEDLRVVRVLVNQAHTFGNGGSFTNGLPFTLSMGCGTWAGNSISENLNWRHFINVTHLVTEIPEDRPSEEQMFGAHWQRYGK